MPGPESTGRNLYGSGTGSVYQSELKLRSKPESVYESEPKIGSRPSVLRVGTSR